METHTHLMVRMAFLPMLIHLVRACREMPTLMMMSTGLWEKEQVITKDTTPPSTINVRLSPPCVHFVYCIKRLTFDLP